MRSAAARTVGLLIFLISGYLLIITSSSNGGGSGGERGSLMGSRPPRCQRRCVSCQECEAIQVPTNPQNSKHGIKTLISSSSSSRAGAARTTSSRGDDDSYSSNYKPMSWKCKCGNVIFNP